MMRLIPFVTRPLGVLNHRVVVGLFLLGVAAACGGDDGVTSPDPGLAPQHLIGVWTLSLSGTCDNDPIDVVLQLMVEGETVDSSTDTRLLSEGHIESRGHDAGNFDGIADRATGAFFAVAPWIQFEGTVRSTGSMEGDWKQDVIDLPFCTGDFSGNKRS